MREPYFQIFLFGMKTNSFPCRLHVQPFWSNKPEGLETEHTTARETSWLEVAAQQ